MFLVLECRIHELVVERLDPTVRCVSGQRPSSQALSSCRAIRFTWGTTPWNYRQVATASPTRFYNITVFDKDIQFSSFMRSGSSDDDYIRWG